MNSLRLQHEANGQNPTRIWFEAKVTNPKRLYMAPDCKDMTVFFFECFNGLGQERVIAVEPINRRFLSLSLREAQRALCPGKPADHWTAEQSYALCGGR